MVAVAYLTSKYRATSNKYGDRLQKSKKPTQTSSVHLTVTWPHMTSFKASLSSCLYRFKHQTLHMYFLFLCNNKHQVFLFHLYMSNNKEDKLQWWPLILKPLECSNIMTNNLKKWVILCLKSVKDMELTCLENTRRRNYRFDFSYGKMTQANFRYLKTFSLL